MRSNASVPDHPVHPDREELAAWQAGALAEPAGAKVQAHLTGCAECTAVVEAAEGARTALASLPEPELPRGLHERLAAAIGEAIDREAAVPGLASAAGARGRAARRRRRWAWNARAATVGAAAALVLLVAGLVPVLRHFSGGSGAQGSGVATASRSGAVPPGAAALPEFSAPGSYSGEALRAAVAANPAVRDAYARAGAGAGAGAGGGGGAAGGGGASGSAGRSAPAAPNAAQGETQLQNGGSARDAGRPAVDQQACLAWARAASSEDLRPAFLVDTVYQGRQATVLVTRSTGSPDQAMLWAFPRGDCSGPPFASERVQVPSP
jgi:hypothetical protein